MTFVLMFSVYMIVFSEPKNRLIDAEWRRGRMLGKMLMMSELPDLVTLCNNCDHLLINLSSSSQIALIF